MQRISTPTAAADMFGAGKNGFNDDPEAGPATEIDAAFLNGIQEELATCIEDQGGTLDPMDLGQLAAAINSWGFSGAVKIKNGASITVQSGGSLVMDSGSTCTINTPVAVTTNHVTSAAVLGTNTSSGPGLRGVSSTNSGVVGSAGGSAAAVEGTNTATGPGVSGTGGSTSGPGVLGTSSSANNPGVRGAGAPAVGSHGIFGLAINTSSYGVMGRSAASATSSAAGVRAEGLGDAPAMSALAVDGVGGLFTSDTSSPKRAALRVTPQDADPSTPGAGDIVVNSSRLGKIRHHTGSGYESSHSSPNGHVFGYGTVADGSNVGTTGDVADAVIVSESTGIVIVEVTGFWNAQADTTTMQVVLKDATAPATVATSPTINTIELDSAATTGRLIPFRFRKPYTLPSGGSRTFTARLDFSATSNWYDVVLTVHGVF